MESRHRQPLVALLSTTGKQMIERLLNAPGSANERRGIVVSQDALHKTLLITSTYNNHFIHGLFRQESYQESTLLDCARPYYTRAWSLET
jgi:hypothetical protein